MHAPTRAAVLAVAAAAYLLVPMASAHSAIATADGTVRGSVGWLGEPVATYSKTGLDLCFTHNVNVTAPATRPPVGVSAGNVTATLRAPTGQTTGIPLAPQAERPGCLTSAAPLVLTQPGQYYLDLAGNVNGSSLVVQGTPVGEPVVDVGNATFPNLAVRDVAELQAALDVLTSQVATLQARLAAVEEAQVRDADEPPGSGRFTPGGSAAALMVGLAAIVAVRRLR